MMDFKSEEEASSYIRHRTEEAKAEIRRAAEGNHTETMSDGAALIIALVGIIAMILIMWR